MNLTPDQAGEVLRSRGMRSTPQRRAILSAFHGGRTEHLSADEVYARASQALPDLSRGTVFATLAEFSEVGLVAAFGVPEPVRYETNTTQHAHLRCRLCARLFDLTTGQPDPGAITDPGFVVLEVELQAEGICDSCTSYGDGLAAGAAAIKDTGPDTETLNTAGTAITELSSPIGSLVLAASPAGLTRLAFEDHGDIDALRTYARGHRGTAAARRHLREAVGSLKRYLSGEVAQPVSTIDWSHLGSEEPTLRLTEAIAYATTLSYSDLIQELPDRELGLMMGANPIPVFMPCHRITRGVVVPDDFVGGADRRTWLIDHERDHPLP